MIDGGYDVDEQLKAALATVPLGIWNDIPKHLFLTEEFFAWYAETLGFDFIQTMIDASDPDPAYMYSPSDIEKLVKLAGPYAISNGLVTWPYPSRTHLDLMKIKMDALLAAGGGYISEWETDQEGNWKSAIANGFTKQGQRTQYDLAGDYLVNIKEELCHKHECLSTITTLTEHMENSPRADTTPFMDLERVQAYAISKRDGLAVLWNSKFGPGRMQKWTIEKAMTIPAIKNGQVKLSVGHAAWMQKFEPPHTPLEAMEVSLRAAMVYNPTDHCWWSLKFVYPKSKFFNGYALDFLRSLRDH